MSRNPQIEEVSDSDPEEMDIALFDPRNTSSSISPAYTPTNPTLLNPSSIPTSGDPPTQYVSASSTTLYKTYQCLYPLYFDSARSRTSGRRVSKPLSTPNPLARTIVDACATLHLKTVFEPGKTHPKDWANPGRVRVLLKSDTGECAHQTITNKFLLYQAVGEYLVRHPTTREDPLKLRIPNMPFNGKPPEPPAVPRGWKVGGVLPLHSAALSGGGVSDDIFKEMMRDMGVQGGGGGGGAGGEVVKKDKKEKKKGKR